MCIRRIEYSIRNFYIGLARNRIFDEKYYVPDSAIELIEGSNTLGSRIESVEKAIDQRSEIKSAEIPGTLKSEIESVEGYTTPE